MTALDQYAHYLAMLPPSLSSPSQPQAEGQHAALPSPTLPSALSGIAAAPVAAEAKGAAPVRPPRKIPVPIPSTMAAANPPVTAALSVAPAAAARDAPPTQRSRASSSSSAEAAAGVTAAQRRVAAFREKERQRRDGLRIAAPTLGKTAKSSGRPHSASTAVASATAAPVTTAPVSAPWSGDAIWRSADPVVSYAPLRSSRTAALSTGVTTSSMIRKKSTSQNAVPVPGLCSSLVSSTYSAIPPPPAPAAPVPAIPGPTVSPIPQAGIVPPPPAPAAPVPAIPGPTVSPIPQAGIVPPPPAPAAPVPAIPGPTVSPIPQAGIVPPAPPSSVLPDVQSSRSTLEAENEYLQARLRSMEHQLQVACAAESALLPSAQLQEDTTALVQRVVSEVERQLVARGVGSPSLSNAVNGSGSGTTPHVMAVLAALMQEIRSAHAEIRTLRAEHGVTTTTAVPPGVIPMPRPADAPSFGTPPSLEIVGSALRRPPPPPSPPPPPPPPAPREPALTPPPPPPPAPAPPPDPVPIPGQPLAAMPAPAVSQPTPIAVPGLEHELALLRQQLRASESKVAAWESWYARQQPSPATTSSPGTENGKAPAPNNEMLAAEAWMRVNECYRSQQQHPVSPPPSAVELQPNLRAPDFISRRLEQQGSFPAAALPYASASVLPAPNASEHAAAQAKVNHSSPAKWERGREDTLLGYMGLPRGGMEAERAAAAERRLFWQEDDDIVAIIAKERAIRELASEENILLEKRMAAVWRATEEEEAAERRADASEPAAAPDP